MNHALDVLKRVNEILDHESRWTQGTYARSASGDPLFELDSNATCFCLAGAIFRAGHELTQPAGPAFDAVREYMGVGSDSDLYDFNDTHTFAEVKSLLAKCIAYAETRDAS